MRKRAAFTELERLRLAEGLLLRRLVQVLPEQHFALVATYCTTLERRRHLEHRADLELVARSQS